MAGKTMSDIAKLSKEKGLNSIADKITLKQEKMRILMNSDIPQYDCRILPYLEFNKENNELMQFFDMHLAQGEGVCVRALPTQEGIRNGFTRKFKYGFLTFQDCTEFLKEKVKDDSLYDVGLTSWIPSDYGIAIISGIQDRKVILAEIGKGVDTLTSGRETPLAGFTIDRSVVGHLENKTVWHIDKDKKARDFLWKTVRKHICLGDGFNPFVRYGYFEAVITQRDELRFIDYDPYFDLKNSKIKK